MAVRTISELSESLIKIIGDRTDDDVITLMEDFNDTLNDYDNRVRDDWKSKYDRLDEEWRRKYISRFNGTSPNEDFDNGTLQHTEVSAVDEVTEIKPDDVTWDDIFN